MYKFPYNSKLDLFKEFYMKNPSHSSNSSKVKEYF